MHTLPGLRIQAPALQSVLLWMLGATAALAQDEAPTLTYYADRDFPPYESISDNGQPVGFNIDLIRAVGAAGGLDVQIVLGTRSDIWASLQHGEPRVAAVAISAHSARIVDHAPAHHTLYGRLVLHPESRSARSIEDLTDVPIAVQADSHLDHHLRQNYPGLPRRVAEGVTEAIQALALGEVDYALIPSYSVASLVRLRGLRELRSVGEPVAVADYGFATPRPHAERLLPALERGLRAVKADGTFDRLEARWLSANPATVSIADLRRWAVSAGPVAVLAAALAWTLALRRSVRRRTRELVTEVGTRRDAEAELQRVTERYELAARFANVGIWDRDLRSATSVWNREMYAQYGLTPRASMDYDDWVAAVHPEDRERATASFDDIVRHGSTPPIEFRVLCPEGGVRHIHSTKGAVRDEHGEVARVIGVNIDITQRKREEQRLQALTERDRLAANFARIGVWEWEPDTDALYVNDEVTRMFGLSQAPTTLAALDKTLIHEEDLPKVEASYQRLFDGAQEDEMHFRARRGDGEVRHIYSAKGAVRSDDGRLQRVVGVNIDITGREREAMRLRSLVERDRLAARLGGVGIWEWDRIDDTFTCNDEQVRITGITPQPGDTLDAWLGQVVHPDDRATVEASYARLEAGASEDEITLRIVRPDGQVRQIHSVKGAVRDASGAIQRIIGIHHDVTDELAAQHEIRKRVEELSAVNARLAEAQHHLVQSEKMAALGQLAAGVAHEINNPIAYVRSNLNTLGSYVDDLTRLLHAYRPLEGDASAEQRGAAERVRTEIDLDYLLDDAPKLIGESVGGADRVRRIVQDLKDFSRVGVSEYEWADLHAGLESTLNIVWHEIKYKAEVQRRYCTDLPPVRCVASQINQIFLNLLVNAAQAISERGTITIETGHDADTAWVEVSDTGRGISAEHLKRVFDPFFTTKPVGEGTGLGLSLALGIAQRHGGSLSARSEPGQGTCFRLTLPLNGPTDNAH